MSVITIKNVEELSENNLNNKIIIDNKDTISLENSVITIKGTNNIIFIDNNVRFKDSKIKIEGNNSVLYFSSNTHVYILDLAIYNDSVFYIGKNNYMNGLLKCSVAERKNLIIGDNNMFSFGIWLRVSDAHAIYCIKDCKRINNGRSVYIGDHVWIGQNAFILKGAHIGSGSIIGANAVTSSTIPSNAIASGNPAKLNKKGIFWDEKCVNNCSYEDLEKNQTYDNPNKYIYEGQSELFDKLECYFEKNPKSQLRYEKIKRTLVSSNNHNRFAIMETKQSFLDKLFKKKKINKK